MANEHKGGRWGNQRTARRDEVLGVQAGKVCKVFALKESAQGKGEDWEEGGRGESKGRRVRWGLCIKERRAGELRVLQDPFGTNSFGTQFSVPKRSLAMLPSHFACWYQNPSAAQTLISSFNYLTV